LTRSPFNIRVACVLNLSSLITDPESLIRESRIVESLIVESLNLEAAAASAVLNPSLSPEHTIERV